MSTFSSIKGSSVADMDVMSLRRENAALQAKVANLQSQLEIVSDVSKDMESVYSKNAQLEKEVRDYQAKYDSLARRLKIVQESKNELESQLEASRLQQNTEITDSSYDYKEKFEEEIRKHKKQIEELNERNAQLMKQNVSASEETLKIKNQLKSVFENASDYFNTGINSVPALTRMFSSKQQISVAPSVSDDEINHANSQAKKWRKKYNQLKGAIHQMQQESELEKEDIVNSADKNIQQLQKELEKSSKELNKHIQINQELEQNILDLENELRELKNNTSNQQRDQKIKYEEEIREVKTELSTANQQIKVMAAQNDSLQKQLSTANAKIRSSDSSRHSMKEAMRASEANNADLKMHLEHVHNELQNVTEALRNTEGKCVKLDSDLKDESERSKGLNMQLSKIRAKYDDLQTALAEARASAAHFEEVLSDVQNEREELSLRLTESRKVNQDLAEKLRSAQSEISNLKEAENERQRRVMLEEKRCREEREKEEESFSSTAWNIPEMPPEAAALAGDIARNPSLRAPAKMRSILSVVIQWFSRREKENIRLIDDLRAEVSKLRESEESFVRSLGRSIPLVGDISNLLDSQSTQDRLISQMRVISERINELNEQKAVSDSHLLELLQVLQSTSIDDAINNANELIGKIGDLYNKSQKQKKIIREMKHTIRARDAETVAQLNGFENDTQAILGQISATEDEKRALEGTVSELNDTISRMRSETAEALKARQREHEAQLNECEKVIKQANERARNESIKRHELEELLTIAGTEKEQLQKTVSLLRISKHRRDAEIQRLKDQQRRVEEELQVRLIAERQGLQAKADNAVAELRKQNAEYQRAVGDLNDSIATLEAEKVELADRLAEQQLDAHQTSVRHQAAIDELERSKALQLAQLRTQTMSQLSELTLKLDAAERRAKEGRRDIMAKVALEFAPLVNTNEALDEANFEALIMAVRKRFDSFGIEEANLRSLLGISESQSIEAAVSELVLSKQM